MFLLIKCLGVVLAKGIRVAGSHVFAPAVPIFAVLALPVDFGLTSGGNECQEKYENKKKRQVLFHYDMENYLKSISSLMMKAPG